MVFLCLAVGIDKKQFCVILQVLNKIINPLKLCIMNKVGFFAGSFSPITRGHLSVFCEALNDYESVIIGVGNNIRKNYDFSNEERCQMVETSVNDMIFEYEHRHLLRRDFSTAESYAIGRLNSRSGFIGAVGYDNFTVDCALGYNATSLIRGERIVGDHDAEMQLSIFNKLLLEVRHAHLNMASIPVSREDLTYISSTAARNFCESGEYIVAMHFVTSGVHALMMRKYLKNRFVKLIESIYVSKNMAEIWYDKLIKTYSENRYYHSLSHIAYCLNKLDIMRTGGHVKDYSRALELAIFFHDWVSGGCKDEDDSCEVLKKSGFDPQLIAETVEIIQATKHNNLPENMSLEQKLMHDLDLAILGDNKNYGTYAINIHREYLFVAHDVYAEKRINVLQRLLDQKELFLLPCFKDQLEENARQNMRNEIAYWQQKLKV